MVKNKHFGKQTGLQEHFCQRDGNCSFVEGVLHNVRLAMVVPFVTEYLPAAHGTICQHATATKQASDTNVAMRLSEGTILTTTFFTNFTGN